MTPTLKLKQLILVVGDVTVFYLALALTLFIRYQEPFLSEILNAHLRPFSLVFAIWILIFYIIGLYEVGSLKNTFNFIKKLLCVKTVKL